MRERALHVIEVLLRHRWLPLIVGLVGAVLMVALGVVGFYQYFAAYPEKAPGSFHSSVIYLAIQLLILQSGAVDGDLSLALEIARFGAPVFTAFTAISALLAVFARRLADWRLQLQQDHIIVCGIGHKGQLIVEDLLARGDAVVAVDPRPLEHGPAGPHGRAQIVTGDATDPAVLRRAGAKHARAIVAASGNDAANIDIAIRASELAGSPTADRPRFYVHLQEPNLQTLLGDATQSGPGVDKRWHFFNLYDRAAEAIFSEYLVFDRETVKRRTDCATITPLPGHAPRLAMVGDSLLADSLVTNLVEIWRPRRVWRGERIGVVLIGPAAQRRLKMLRNRIPDLDDVCDVTVQNQHISEMEAAERAAALDGVTTIYVCQEGDAITASIALSLLRQTAGSSTRIIAGFDRRFGLVQLVRNAGLASAPAKAGRLAPFPSNDACRHVNTEAEQADEDRLATFSLGESCRLADLLLDGVTAQLSELIYETWRKNRIDQGKTEVENEYLNQADKDARTAALRSSLHQARHTLPKLRRVGCTIRRAAPGATPLFKFCDAEIKLLARLEHDRWNDERLLDGWELGKTERRLQIHENLMPWDCITVEIQQYDVESVESLPEVLRQVGFEIVRQPVNAHG